MFGVNNEPDATLNIQPQWKEFPKKVIATMDGKNKLESDAENWSSATGTYLVWDNLNSGITDANFTIPMKTISYSTNYGNSGTVILTSDKKNTIISLDGYFKIKTNGEDRLEIHPDSWNGEADLEINISIEWDIPAKLYATLEGITKNCYLKPGQTISWENLSSNTTNYAIIEGFCINNGGTNLFNQQTSINFGDYVDSTGGNDDFYVTIGDEIGDTDIDKFLSITPLWSINQFIIDPNGGYFEDNSSFDIRTVELAANETMQMPYVRKNNMKFYFWEFRQIDMTRPADGATSNDDSFTQGYGRYKAVAVYIADDGAAEVPGTHKAYSNNKGQTRGQRYRVGIGYDDAIVIDKSYVKIPWYACAQMEYDWNSELSISCEGQSELGILRQDPGTYENVVVINGETTVSRELMDTTKTISAFVMNQSTGDSGITFRATVPVPGNYNIKLEGTNNQNPYISMSTNTIQFELKPLNTTQTVVKDITIKDVKNNKIASVNIYGESIDNHLMGNNSGGMKISYNNTTNQLTYVKGSVEQIIMTINWMEPKPVESDTNDIYVYMGTGKVYANNFNELQNEIYFDKNGVFSPELIEENNESFGMQLNKIYANEFIVGKPE